MRKRQKKKNIRSARRITRAIRDIVRGWHDLGLARRYLLTKKNRDDWAAWCASDTGSPGELVTESPFCWGEPCGALSYTQMSPCDYIILSEEILNGLTVEED